MAEWQPIETAPKDGTKVALYAKMWLAESDTFLRKIFYQAYYFRDSMNQRNQRWVDVGSIFDCKQWHPTHWAPLLEPPKEPDNG